MATDETHVEWADDEEGKLVELWREKPSLYDTSSKLYSNRQAKRLAMEEIGRAVPKPVDEVSEKMKNLRTQFSRLAKCPPSGSERKKLTVHQQWVHNNLQFLQPYLKARESSSTLQTNTRDLDADSIDTEQDASFISSDDESGPPPGSVTERPAKERKAGPSERINRDKLAILGSIAESIAKPIEFPAEKQDADSVFGEYVASRLREINDQRIKLKLEGHNK